jgi:uncharacterized cupredoxin-like copper-binding protein
VALVTLYADGPRIEEDPAMPVPTNPRALAALAAVSLVVAACGPGPSAPAATQAGPTVGPPAGTGLTSGDVAVTLQEWAVVPAPATATAGDVTFTITNSGPEDEHEFVVIRTDLDPGALPTDSTGAVDEAGAGIEVVDEVEEIAVDQSEELTVNLTAGNYVLICNIFDETENESHYQMGMRIAFDVQG